MKKTVKIMLLLVALVLVCSCALVACGNKNNNTNNSESAEDAGSPEIAVADYNYVQPTPVTLSQSELRSFLRPYLTDIFKVLGDEDDVDEVLDSLTNDDYISLAELLGTAGFSAQKLSSLASSASDGWTLAMDILDKVENKPSDKSMSAFVKEVATADNISVILTALDGVFSNIDACSVLAFAKTIINAVSDQFSYYAAYHDGIDYLTSKELNAKLSAAELNLTVNDFYYDKFAPVYKWLSSNNGVYTLKHLFSAFSALKNFDSSKLVSVVDVVFKALEAANNGGIGSILSGESLSYKTLVGAVNTVGSLLKTFVGGLGDAKVLDSALKPLFEDIALIADFPYAIPTTGLMQTCAYACDLLATVSFSDVAAIYGDYDDYAKAAENEKDKKLGCLIANAATLLNQNGGINETVIDFVCNVGEGVGLLDSAKAKEFALKAIAKKSDDMSDGELIALAEEVENVLDNSNEYDVNYGRTIYLTKGASSADIKKAVYDEKKYNCEIDFDDYTYSLEMIDDARGYIHMKNDEKDYKLQAYIVVPAATDRYVMYHSSWINSEIFAISSTVNKDEFKGTSNFYLLDKNTGYSSIALWKLLTKEDIEISSANFELSSAGKKITTVTYSCQYGSVTIPYFYYVYDPANPVLTGVSVPTHDIFVGGTLADTVYDISAIYDYGYNPSKDLSLSDVTVTGFDSSTTGEDKRMTVSYKGVKYEISYSVVYAAQQVTESGTFALKRGSNFFRVVPENDCYIAVTNDDDMGMKLYENSISGSCLTSSWSHLNYKLKAGKTYYLKVSNYSGNSTIEITLEDAAPSSQNTVTVTNSGNYAVNAAYDREFDVCTGVFSYTTGASAAVITINVVNCPGDYYGILLFNANDYVENYSQYDLLTATLAPNTEYTIYIDVATSGQIVANFTIAAA